MNIHRKLNTVIPWCLYPGVNRIHDVVIKYLYYRHINYSSVQSYSVYHTESSSITLFKDFYLEIIKVKVKEKIKKTFSVILAWISFPTRSLNNVRIIGDSDRPNRIVQMNILHFIYSVTVIWIFDVKFMYSIYPQGIYIKVLR